MKGTVQMNNLDAAILGVKLTSKILEIPEPKVFFVDDNNINKNMITGIFIYDDYEILFNESWVLNSEWIEIMVTAFHETRHAYQCYSIKHNKNEDKITLENWKNDFENYKTASGTNNPKLDIDYLTQTIELDAIKFTHYKIKELFNVKTIIPDQIKSKIISN